MKIPANTKIAWDITVAMAAPATPMSNVNINIGSSITLIIADIPLNIVGAKCFPVNS